MKSRPAESAGVAAAIAALVGRVAGIDDPDTLAYMAVAVGVIPAAVTLLVANGGLIGLGRKLLRGNPRKGS